MYFLELSNYWACNHFSKSLVKQTKIEADIILSEVEQAKLLKDPNIFILSDTDIHQNTFLIDIFGKLIYAIKQQTFELNLHIVGKV